MCTVSGTRPTVLCDVRDEIDCVMVPPALKLNLACAGFYVQDSGPVSRRFYCKVGKESAHDV